MPQGAQTSGFSFNETMLLALGPIPPLPDRYIAASGDGSKPLLLTPPLGGIAKTRFYTDNVFRAGKDFYNTYDLLEQHLLLRIA
jgi:hypothetical protein